MNKNEINSELTEIDTQLTQDDEVSSNVQEYDYSQELNSSIMRKNNRRKDIIE